MSHNQAQTNMAPTCPVHWGISEYSRVRLEGSRTPAKQKPVPGSGEESAAAAIRSAMSLALIQGYSSAEEGNDERRYAGEEEEEEEEEEAEQGETSSSSSDVDGGGREVLFSGRNRRSGKKSSNPTTSPGGLLPSALDAFSEIARPPDFLNNCVVEAGEAHDSLRETGRRGRHRGRKTGRDKKDLPAGVVMEAKAQLVGIRDRVRTDIDGSPPPILGSTVTTTGESKRVVTATNPEPKDAADLLRMCVQCGIPKTYSHTRGMVCPVCGDRPPADPDSLQDKKKGSTIKDKEKSKRMKGQSSHSSWKSETEMQLRQQFD